MNVIWHDDENIQRDLGAVRWNRLPDGLRDLSGGIRVHGAVDDSSEQHFSLMSADRDEIATRIAIVETLQTWRFALRL